MQCFVVNFEDIKGKRIDPSYYLNPINIKHSISLGSVVDVKGGKRIPKGYYYSDNITSFKYLRVDNIGENGFIDWGNLKFISGDVYRILERYKIENDDVIISIAGTIGKISYVENLSQNVILTENCAKLIVKQRENLLPSFLKLILELPLSQKQMQQGFIHTTIPKLGLDKIKDLQISLPQIEVQEQIITIMDKAHNSRKAMEAEAEGLLSGIDDYVLGELGIKITEVKQKKCFVVMVNEIKEGRIDPDYCVEKNSYKQAIGISTKTISELLGANLLVGKKGASITKSKTLDGNIPVIAGGQSVPYYHDQSNFNNAITISSSGAYAGYVWYHDYPFWASDCTVICSSNENKISTEYLFYFLKSQQKTIYKRQRGAGQPHVYLKDLEDFIIPLPPLETQNKIALEVKTRTQKATQLKEEAKSLLQKAKDEVEKMILGN